MIFTLKTGFKNGRGFRSHFVKMYLECYAEDVRDRVRAAIEKALADPPAPKSEKASAIGFHHPGEEDQ